MKNIFGVLINLRVSELLPIIFFEDKNFLFLILSETPEPRIILSFFSGLIILIVSDICLILNLPRTNIFEEIFLNIWVENLQIMKTL